jgi:hypothetical protein
MIILSYRDTLFINQCYNMSRPSRQQQPVYSSLSFPASPSSRTVEIREVPLQHVDESLLLASTGTLPVCPNWISPFVLAQAGVDAVIVRYRAVAMHAVFTDTTAMKKMPTARTFPPGYVGPGTE